MWVISAVEARADIVERLGVLEVVARDGVEPSTFRFSVGRSYQLSYLAEQSKASFR